MSLRNILTKNEISNVYFPKELSYEEKVQSFSTNDGKLIFILIYGYFKAFNQFFDQQLFSFVIILINDGF